MADVARVAAGNDYAKLRELHPKATQGTWQWFGSLKMKEVYLATYERGRQIVMDFDRWGMGNAQPRFQVRFNVGGGVMCKLADLSEYTGYGPKMEVEPDSKGRYYRTQFAGISHPDAEWIAAACPTVIGNLLDDLDAARAELKALRAQIQDHRQFGAGSE